MLEASEGAFRFTFRENSGNFGQKESFCRFGGPENRELVGQPGFPVHKTRCWSTKSRFHPYATHTQPIFTHTRGKTRFSKNPYATRTQPIITRPYPVFTRTREPGYALPRKGCFFDDFFRYYEEFRRPRTVARALRALDFNSV